MLKQFEQQISADSGWGTAEQLHAADVMAALIDWTSNSLVAKELHPLLIIAVFILFFLGIHPFLDGNGRLSRILATLLLLQQGYAILKQEKDRAYLKS